MTSHQLTEKVRCHVLLDYKSHVRQTVARMIQNYLFQNFGSACFWLAGVSISGKLHIPLEVESLGS